MGDFNSRESSPEPPIQNSKIYVDQQSRMNIADQEEDESSFID